MNHTAVLVLASNGILLDDAGRRVGAMILPMFIFRFHLPARLVYAARAAQRTARAAWRAASQAWHVAFGPGWGEDLKLMWGAVVEPLGGVYA